MSPETKEFWDFTWHEIGFYDLPAMIDLVLNQTGSDKLFYVGHSQGTTVACVLLCTKPNYNDKIVQLHLMAPAVFMEHLPHPIGRPLMDQFDVRY